MSRQLTLKGDKPSSSPDGQRDANWNKDPVPDNTALEAKVVSVEERDSRWDDEHNPGQKKRELNFKFEVDDPAHPDLRGRWFWGNTTAYFGSAAANKLRQWITVIEDEDILPEGFIVDLDEIEARKPRVRIIVKAYEKRDGTIGNEVKELRPSRLGRIAPTPEVSDPF